MFLSAQHLRFRPRWIRRRDLRVLDRLHALSGQITTPLFHHAGSSSWHSKSMVRWRNVGGQLGWAIFAGAVFVVLWVTLRIRVWLDGRG